MNARLLLIAAALAAPVQALELNQPEIRFESDCSVLLVLRLAVDAEVDPKRVRFEIASPPTYRKFQKAYPSWVSSAQLERIRQAGEDRIRVRSTQPLPAHPSDLMLVLGQGYQPPVFHTLKVPPCTPSGVTRKVVWGDTLLEIALEHARALKTDAYTLMLAIQLHNRDAFIRDNINLVRAGARLYIPSQAEIARLNLPRRWLINEVRFQNEQWRQWRVQRSDVRESPTLQAQRLRLVPIEVRVEPAVVESDQAEPVIAEAVEPEPAGTQPAASDQTEPAQTPPAEPEPAASEQTEPEPDKTEAPPATVEIESGGLKQLTDEAAGTETAAEIAARLPWPGILAAAGILLLAWLFGMGLDRARQARVIRQSVGEIEDPARRATSALDLAHAHVEAEEYDQARALIRLVLAEGTEQEREEAEKLKSRMAST